MGKAPEHTLERPLLGWPDTTVRFVMHSPDNFEVTVGEYKPYTFNNAKDAIDMYRHPFAMDTELEVDINTLEAID